MAYGVPTVNSVHAETIELRGVADDRRRILHCNVTAHPSAEWTAQQMREACPWETAPRFLLRDRDGIYGGVFRDCVAAMGIEEIRTAPRSPSQNPFCGAANRVDPQRVPGPCDRPQRKIAAGHSRILYRLPAALAHTSGAGQGRPDHEETPDP